MEYFVVASHRQGKRKTRFGQLRSSRGQIVVEYVLLLIISVVIAMLITTYMVSRNAESPGFLIQTWRAMIDTLGADRADDLNANDTKN